MQQSMTKTPCRRVGLRRIANTVQSEPTTSSQVIAGDVSGYGNAAPNLSAAQSNGSNSPPLRRHSTEPAMPLDASLSGVESSDSSTDHSKVAVCKRPLSFKEEKTLKDDNFEDDNKAFFKKTKLTLSETPPTQDDLCALQRSVALKEKQLQELHQAEIICRKHDPEKLSREMKHWLWACQEALQELLLAVNSRGNCLQMDKLLHEVGIPPELVQYNFDSEEFEGGE